LGRRRSSWFVQHGGLGGPAVRLVVAKAERRFNQRQAILINRFLLPTWGFVIGNAIKNGDLPDNPQWQKVSWHTPKKVTIDAGREAQQNREDIELGLKSASEDYAERGADFKEQLIRRANDFRLIKEIAAKYDVPEGWLWRPTRADPDKVAEAEAEASNEPDGDEVDGKEPNDNVPEKDMKPKKGKQEKPATKPKPIKKK
jgi:capsid protein